MSQDTRWFHDRVVDEDERRAQGRYWLNLAKLSACAACLLYLLGLALPAKADTTIPLHVIEHDTVRMRLLPTPCADPMSLAMAAQMSPPQFHARWKATSSDWKMRDGQWQTFDGCWLEVTKEEADAPDAVLFFVFSDGQYGNALKGAVIKPKGQGA